MPTELMLWKIENERPRLVPRQKLDLESRIEDWLRQDITLISDDLLEEIAVVAPIDKLGQALWARCEGVLDRISLYDALEFADTADYWRTLIRDFRAAAEAPRPSPQA